VETIGRFPADPAVQAELEKIEVEAGEIDDALAPGQLVIEHWLSPRRISKATVAGTFALVGSSVSLAYLHSRVSNLLPAFGLQELDASALRSGQRELTQSISRIVFECSTSAGDRQFDGIRYLSRYGDEFENWGIYEPASIESDEAELIVSNDPDLLEAAERLSVTLL
jgi:hypothetical protein